MKNIFFTITLFISSLAFSQELDPPTIAMPSEANKILIDELIRVTEFENYFTNYCKNKIEQAAKEKRWSEKKKQETIRSIDFKYFKDSIYNTFASDSMEDLNKIIFLFKDLNSKRNEGILKIIPINEMMQLNLDGFVKSVIEEKYLSK